MTREINSKKQHHEGYAKGQAQSQEDRGDAELESQSRGTTSRRVPQLEKEMDQMRKVMAKMRENMRRTNPVENLVHRSWSLQPIDAVQHQLAPSVGRAVHLQFVFLRQRVEWFEPSHGLLAQDIKRVGMLQAIPNATISQP